MTDSSGVLDPGQLLKTSLDIAAAYARAAVLPGDVVLSIGPSYGKVLIVPPELNGANLTQGTARLSPGPGTDAHWLFWALQSNTSRAFWDLSVGGATFRALNLGPLSDTPMPSLASWDQRRIAEFLDDQVARITDAVNFRGRQTATVSEYCRASLVGALLTGGSDTMRVRSLIADERLGAWGDEPNEVDDVNVARVADFDREMYLLPDAPTVRSLPSTARAARLLRRGDVLLERSGGGPDKPVGSAVYFGGSKQRTVTSNFVSRLRPQLGVDGRYLSLILAAMYEARWSNAHYTQTTGIQNLNSESYLNLRVPSRDGRAQQNLAVWADALLQWRASMNSALAQSIGLLEERQRALITACVTGEFDVSSASTRAADAVIG